MLSLLTTVLFAVSPGPGPVAYECQEIATGELQRTDEEVLQARLDRLVETIERERVENHIPGLALVVVHGDEIVLARGFGLADIEGDRPVDPETIFCIGSCSKAFTATLVGLLEDQGVMDYDDAVTKHLPYFELSIEGPDSRGDTTVTLRDLLSHRTGFTRMSPLFLSEGVPTRTILETATKAEPMSGFREKFLYTNVMYLAAGTAAAEAGGASWEELIEARIFEPLGMHSSRASIAEAQEDERLAVGYQRNQDTNEFDPVNLESLNAIGPAGGINSNAIDMAQWLRFQLAGGMYDGQRVMSEEAILDTRTSNIMIGQGFGYGLGWMVREHAGQPLVEHGGNVGGYASKTAFLPEADLGFVLLTNVVMTPLQDTSVGIVFDELLGLNEGRTSLAASDYEEFVGKYRANFASFKDAHFEIVVKNGNLAVDIPGQMAFDLNDPNEEGRWVFKLSAANAVSFVRDEDGVVIGMKMHEGQAAFELPREGVEVAEVVPTEDYAPFLGKYFIEDMGVEVEVLVQGGRLAIDIPGQMVFELHDPDEEGKRYFRITDQVAIRFTTDGGGRASSLTIFEGDGEGVAMRVDDGEEEVEALLPSIEDLAELRSQNGTSLLEKHETVRITGSIRYAQAGVEGTYVMEARANPKAYTMRVDLGAFGVSDFGCDEDSAWTYTALAGEMEASGPRLAQILRGHPSVLEGDWSEAFDTLRVLEARQKGDSEILVVRGEFEGLPPRTLYVDVDTGRLVRMDYTFVELEFRLPTETRFGDFREVDGTMFPFRSSEKNVFTGRVDYQVEKVELDVELADDFHERN